MLTLVCGCIYQRHISLRLLPSYLLIPLLLYSSLRFSSLLFSPSFSPSSRTGFGKCMALIKLIHAPLLFFTFLTSTLLSSSVSPENFTFISSYAEDGTGQVGVYERSAKPSETGECPSFPSRSNLHTLLPLIQCLLHLSNILLTPPSPPLFLSPLSPLPLSISFIISYTPPFFLLYILYRFFSLPYFTDSSTVLSYIS